MSDSQNTKELKLHHGDCLKVLNKIPENHINLIFADPPYNLSNGGISCKGGKMVSVNKGKWDKSNGFQKDYEFTYNWLKECKRVLKPNGTIWVSGTMHNIYLVGHAMQALGYHIINEISWFKSNAPPNLSCRYFTHSHETLIWAKKDKKSKHFFNYAAMKRWSDSINPENKQMRSVWSIPYTPKSEKIHGNHPTQKPMELLRRIVISSSKIGDLVLDPFCGSGSTGAAAIESSRKFIGIEKYKKYLNITEKRIKSIKKTLSNHQNEIFEKIQRT